MDWQIFSYLNGLAGHWAALDAVMVVLAKYGPVLLALPLIMLWFMGSGEDRTAHRQTAIRAVAASALALLLNHIIGYFYFRPRPFIAHNVHLLAPAAHDSSFPSDHAAGSWALAWGVRQSPALVSIPMTILATLISIARIYVGAHYPTDVIGGALIGVAATYLVELLWPLLMSSKVERLVRLATRIPRHSE